MYAMYHVCDFVFVYALSSQKALAYSPIENVSTLNKSPLYTPTLNIFEH